MASLVSRFKYCVNGEDGFTSVKHDEQIKPAHVKDIAVERIKRKYLKKFGTYNLTDIKRVNYGSNAANS